MRETGWEYDETKFGPDPTYADLYDGSYGPTNSVLAVAEDPLALLFYFMPPSSGRRLLLKATPTIDSLFRSAHGRFGRSSVKVVAKWRISGTFGSV
ncbi:hypothetical protein PR003_g24500 [Phytophthora rubi]|uniref:Uncharacterized protein n=1 Tax=Phytophthora rubi TaxID=129364 RepID=A0A6A3K7G4_9STRA|nr:hypothetical protein PR002_g17296 [Phytophthora rubi]KAE9020035.1 hypothetical protein PR001_g13713 [Phytophthora rubi]KAE9293449.1 hypothetical protein PR003_g24500 [Phytophthora rubi]